MYVNRCALVLTGWFSEQIYLIQLAWLWSVGLMSWKHFLSSFPLTPGDKIWGQSANTASVSDSASRSTRTCRIYVLWNSSAIDLMSALHLACFLIHFVSKSHVLRCKIGLIEVMTISKPNLVFMCRVLIDSSTDDIPPWADPSISVSYQVKNFRGQ